MCLLSYPFVKLDLRYDTTPLARTRTYLKQFQIQCDFITQASREDIERSERNEAILSGVAKTFRDAVLDFCGHCWKCCSTMCCSYSAVANMLRNEVASSYPTVTNMLGNEVANRSISSYSVFS